MHRLSRTVFQLSFKSSENVSKRQHFCSEAKSHINDAVIHLPARMPNLNDPSHPLHIVTPLLKSNSMTKMLSSSSFPRTVYLKLENVQPSGSFKIRGIGWTMQEAVRNGSLQFVGSSGGNAGLAMAYAAGKLGKKLTLFVPRTTPAFMEKKIIDEGAEVFLVGENWDEANEAALAKVAEDSYNSTFMVHPHNQPTTWEGHSSLVDELMLQLSELGEEVPSCIVTAVGGGGLAMGLLHGMDKHGWHEAVLLGMQTSGAASFCKSVEQGKLVTLDTVNTKATSLAMRKVIEELFILAKEQSHRVKCKAVSDMEALDACIRFADDQRLLVEPACGAALTGVYGGGVKEVAGHGPVVVIVCGGNIANTDTVGDWKEELELNKY